MFFINHYSTSQIAKLIGVHPNTVRFYEEMKLLPEIPRTESGYRIFHDGHLKQLQLLRTAFKAEIISGRLRHEAVQIVKSAASGEIEGAYLEAQEYYKHLTEEKENAEEAIRITLELVENCIEAEEYKMISSRREAAQLLGITIDVLRDWERNGLIEVPRDDRGYRKYGSKEIKRLKIIRTLRNAHYSMMSILRMLNRLDKGEMDLRQAIDTPREDEDIVCAADRYISALCSAEKDAAEMIEILENMDILQETAR